MPDLHDFYIWLLLQGTPIAVLIQRCFVVRKGRKKRDQKTKTKVYFCRTTTLHSVADVRSWIYKTKAVSALPTCCSFLLTEGWEINGSSSKENTFPVCWSKTFGNMSTVSKWQLQVCHFICSLLRISHVLIVALVPLLLFPFFLMLNSDYLHYTGQHFFHTSFPGIISQANNSSTC